MWNRYANWLLRQRIWIIALTLLVTAFLAWQAAGLRVVINPSELTPPDHPYVIATNHVQASFGSKYLMVIGLTPKQGDALQPAVLGLVERLTRRLEEMPGVVRSSITSLAARQAKSMQNNEGMLQVRPLLPRQGNANAEILRQVLKDNPIYQGAVISSDYRTAAILLELKEHPQGFQEMVEPVRKMVAELADERIDVALSGNPVYLAQTETYAQRIFWLFPLAVLVIGLLHWEAFRSWQGLVLPLVTALMAVAWGLGFMGLMGRTLDIFNAPAPILILAVAAGHAVQLLKRYYEQYALLLAQGLEVNAATNSKAVIDSMVNVGPVMVVAGGVAALGLFSLTVFAIPTIRTFGIFTGVGILSAVLLEMSFIPALRSLLRPPNAHELRRESNARVWDRITSWVSGQLIEVKHRRRIFIMVITVVALCALGARLIVVDNATRHYFSNKLPIQQNTDFLNRQLGGTNSLYIMIEGKTDDAIKSPQMLASIEHLQKTAQEDSQVGKTLSIVDYVRRMQQVMDADIYAAAALPKDQAMVSQYLLMYDLAGEPGDFGAFVDTNYRKAKILIMLRTGSNSHIKALVQRLEAQARQSFGPDVQVSFGGDAVQAIALTDIMVGSKLVNIAQVLLAIFFISALVFRSLLAGVIVIAPLIVALLAVFGVMGALSIPLNIPNALIAAMAAGIGGDYAIYLLYRLREEVREGYGHVQATQNALATAGKASLYVATAVAGGYGVLALSNGFYVHIWTALFIGVAMLASVFASLTLVPGLVLSWKPAFIFSTKSRASTLGPTVLGMVLIAITSVFFHQYARAQDRSAEAVSALRIMQLSADASRTKDSSANVNFTLKSADGSTRVRQTNGLTKLQNNGKDTMRLVRFLSPPDIKGSSTLLIENSRADDAMWIYLPSLGKVRRLSAANKRDAFFGTDFSYGDIMGHQPDRWQHKLLREELIEGALFYVIESTPLDDETRLGSGYSRRLSWIHQVHYVPLRVDIWDLAANPLKRIVFSDVRPVGGAGKHQAMQMVANNLQTSHQTTIKFEDFKADVGIDVKQFSAQRLEP